MTYVIAGATGNTGSHAAKTLLERGRKVRVIVRSADKGAVWKERGAEVAIADLADAAAMARALDGAEGAYLLIPPNMGAPDFRAYQAAVTEGLVGAIRKSRVPHVVFLSSVGAHLTSGTGPVLGLHHAERAFATIDGTRFSFIRAGYFMENFGGSLGMLDQGILPSFVPASFAMDMIATRDIGVLAADLLEAGSAAPPIVELGGPARTTNDAAAALSQIVGKTITVHEAPVAGMAAALQSFGLSSSIAALYQEMIESFLGGRIGWEGGHERRPGTTTLEEVLRGLVTKP
jgi:uncharacterized protein YbjT (DUF2867 family)